MSNDMEPVPQGGPSSIPAGPKPFVVCVDDDLQVLNALERTLKIDGYEVWATDRPQNALHWLKTGRVSVLVVDQRMPDMKGAELLQAAQELSPKTVRILLTAFPGDPIVLKALGKIDLCMIGKPWDDEALRTVIRERLRDYTSSAWEPPPAFIHLHARAIERENIGSAYYEPGDSRAGKDRSGDENPPEPSGASSGKLWELYPQRDRSSGVEANDLPRHGKGLLIDDRKDRDTTATQSLKISRKRKVRQPSASRRKVGDGRAALSRQMVKGIEERNPRGNRNPFPLEPAPLAS
jgi:CheY-like chemotaxis protein